MKSKPKSYLILMVILPFLIGYGINMLLGKFMVSSALVGMMVIINQLWQIVAIIFWAYVGIVFGSLQMAKIKSFFWGNSLWMLSLCLFIWQFFLLNDENRNLIIAGLSQHYVLGFMSTGYIIMNLFSDSIDFTYVTVLAYLIMLIVFIAGFTYGSKKNKI